MSDFGCFYNPKPAPGRCIKDSNNTTVEAQCEKVENHCRLKRLSLNPQDSFNPMGVILTGNKLADYQILNYLSDEELVNLCEIIEDSNVYKYCNSESYWRNRTEYKFPYLSYETMNKYRGDRLWSEYYIKDLREGTKAINLPLAASKGRRDLIYVAIKNGVDYIPVNDYVIAAAVEPGDIEFLKDLLDMGF